MGQQQLMITILVTVIVGIATIVAMNTMLESRKGANRDGVQSDMVFIINESQQYFYRPSLMNGGNRSFDDISSDNISIGDSTENGTYTISGSGNTLVVEGNGSFEGVYLKATVTYNPNDYDDRFNIQWSNESN